MTKERVLKNFGALSFEENAATGESPPAPFRFQPRPTPESVQNFNVHQDGSADTKPQPKRPGRQGARVSTRRDEPAPDSTQSEARDNDARNSVSSGEEFREMLHRRAVTPFFTAIPYHRWGLNE